MTDTETTTTPYVTTPNAPYISLGDDARIYAYHSTEKSVVGPDYIGVELYGVAADLTHVGVGQLTMTPSAANALYRELGSALTLRDTFRQVSA